MTAMLTNDVLTASQKEQLQRVSCHGFAVVDSLTALFSFLICFFLETRVLGWFDGQTHLLLLERLITRLLWNLHPSCDRFCRYDDTTGATTYTPRAIQFAYLHNITSTAVCAEYILVYICLNRKCTGYLYWGTIPNVLGLKKRGKGSSGSI